MVSHHIRVPRVEDGVGIARLARQIPELDSYSSYLYLVLCERFAETCAILLDADGACCGFVTGMLDPRSPNTLFVWQVGLRADVRGQGVGKRMIMDILDRQVCRQISFVETTVTSNNISSQRLFASLARSLETPCETLPGYPASLFLEQHDSEPMLRIGPFRRRFA